MRSVNCLQRSLMALSILIVAAQPAWALDENTPRDPGKILYRVSRDADFVEMAEAAWTLTLHNAQPNDKLYNMGVELDKVDLRGMTEEQFAAALMATGAVDFAEPDYLVAPADTVPNDSGYSNQWQHQKIQSEQAWDIQTGDGSIKIAIVDTGVQTAHPDLASRLILPGKNTADNGTDVEPINQHGTFVAGCAAAIGNNSAGVTGTCWNAQIIPIKASNLPGGEATISALANGVTWGVDNGARIVNVSYSGFESSTIESAGQYARTNNALLFMAAGNENANLDSYPDSDTFILVGSTDSSDAKSSFSNFGHPIDIVAPGSSVYSTTMGSAYSFGSGTSYSSPIAAGLGALILMQDSSLTISELESILFQSCDDLGNIGDDRIFGRGRINAFKALSATVNGLNANATMQSPTPASTLSSISTTFSWSSGNQAVQYYLSIGSTVGGQQYLHKDMGTSTSHTISSLPTDGSALHVRLWTRFADTGWQTVDYTYTAHSTTLTPAAMTSPANGATLTSSSASFNWSAGNGATQYFLMVGDEQGASNLFAWGGVATSVNAAGLPTDGSTLHVRLWSFIGDAWQFNDYSYTAFDPSGVIATLSAPTNGSTLSSNPINFSWSTGTGVSQYYVSIGTSAGARNVLHRSMGTSTNVAYNVPLDGNPVYLRIWSRIGTDWHYNDYNFNTANVPTTPATVSSPTNGATLSGVSQLLSWNAGSGVTSYYVMAGSSQGASNYFGWGGAGTSVTVSNLPIDGSTIHIRLWSLIEGLWYFNDYSYTAFNGGAQAGAITSPTSGSTFGGASVTFNWSAGGGATEYWLSIGSNSQGARDLLHRKMFLNTSYTFNNMPTDGRTIWVRLWSRVGGTWVADDVQYTASN